MSFARIIAFRMVTQQPETLLAFYTALGFSVGTSQAIAADELAMLGLAGGGMRWPMRLGNTSVDLDSYDAAGRAYPNDANAASTVFQHLALVTDDAAAFWRRARAVGAAPISRDGPVTLPPSSGGVTAIKFRDPEGHPLELLQFPDPGAKGWHGSGLLGVDHSAVVVADLAASETFYATHGLMRGDATLNEGSGQASLDGLDNPVAHVVPMKPATAPPHVELLHYYRPGGPAGTPVDVRDVAATRIVWQGGRPALLHDSDGHFQQTGG